VDLVTLRVSIEAGSWQPSAVSHQRLIEIRESVIRFGLILSIAIGSHIAGFRIED
jgi:hypothetical protein